MTTTSVSPVRTIPCDDVCSACVRSIRTRVPLPHDCIAPLVDCFQHDRLHRLRSCRPTHPFHQGTSPRIYFSIGTRTVPSCSQRYPEIYANSLAYFVCRGYMLSGPVPLFPLYLLLFLAQDILVLANVYS